MMTCNMQRNKQHHNFQLSAVTLAHKGINGTFAFAGLLYTTQKDKFQEP